MGGRARRCLRSGCPQSCFPGDAALGAAARPGCPGRFENHRCAVDAPPTSRSVGTGQAVSNGHRVRVSKGGGSRLSAVGRVDGAGAGPHGGHT